MRAASEFGDLTFSGSACGRKKVSISTFRQLLLQSTLKILPIIGVNYTAYGYVGTYATPLHP